jgi:hypothetical protein
MINLRVVKSKKDLKKFIHLPYKIHKDHKEWLPPLLSDEWKVFDRNKNHSFEHCDTILLLAEKDKEIVGRIMGIINHTYNKGHGEKNGRFSFIETYDDLEVFDALLEAVQDWAREKGMEKIIGPLGFSDKDPQGLLIEGLDDPMTVMVTNCNFPYMVDHVERHGFKKKIDLVQYRMEIPESVPEVYIRVSERIKKRGFKILEFDKTRQVRPYIKPVFDLINEAYTDIYGFAPLTDIESKEFSERFLPLLDSSYIKIVTYKEEGPVAFVVAMPDISEGFRKAKGKLFPFGFIHILRSMKKTKQLNLLLGCVQNRFQNFGLDALMAVSILESSINGKLEVIDSHLVMEENVKMRAVCERIDGKMYKKYRIYEKDL